MRDCIDQMPHQPSDQLKEQYFQQYKSISNWYSLNQIMVFFERYDLGYYDFLVQDLTRNNFPVTQLENDHAELINYVRTGICPAIFPTIEEYKQYMRRIIDALENILGNPDQLTIYPFRFNTKSNELLIERHKPIKITRDTKISVLTLYLVEKNWGDVDFTTVRKEIGFEPNEITRVVRHLNDRVANPFPKFLITPKHLSKPNEKIITVSASYKLSK